MRHFLAFGNSDQESFRDREVRSCFDYLTVPGTIAAYYQDATAAFVLSSGLRYVIDPRTPLFQGEIVAPKASHYSLAEHHGEAIRQVLGDRKKRTSAAFEPSMFTPNVITDMTQSVVAFQRTYATRVNALQQQLSRYARLKAIALGEPQESSDVTAQPPSFILLPYFSAANSQDEWMAINRLVWMTAADNLPEPTKLSAVVAVQDASVLSVALSTVPTSLSNTTFFWVAGLDERRSGAYELRQMARSVLEHSDARSLINLYGGFFSICLHYLGLWGFSNGLAYSESRDWPDLSSTGAAPARYYVRPLHAFLPPATAQALTEYDGFFACPCPVCETRSIVELSYHELKRHFALARKWELEMVHTSDRQTVAQHLQEVHSRMDRIRREQLPIRLPLVDYLLRWASVLTDPTLGTTQA